MIVRRAKSRLSTLAKQTWQIDDGSTTRNGCELAERLVDLGFRIDHDATRRELIQTPVACYITTGVSAWRRIA